MACMLQARFESFAKLPVGRGHYAAPVDNEEALRIVDACHSIRNYPGIFDRMRRSVMRRIEACVESHGDILIA
jgi:hypothetical protein